MLLVQGLGAMPVTRGPRGTDTCLAWVLLSELSGETPASSGPCPFWS